MIGFSCLLETGRKLQPSADSTVTGDPDEHHTWGPTGTIHRTTHRSALQLAAWAAAQAGGVGTDARGQVPLAAAARAGQARILRGAAGLAMTVTARAAATGSWLE
jgi:hypothetical protein